MEAAIEAILFTMGDSVELTQIAKAVEQDKETTRKVIHHMMDRYQEGDRGIQIIELERLLSDVHQKRILREFDPDRHAA